MTLRLGLALLGIVVLFAVVAVLDGDDRVIRAFYTDQGEEPWPLGERVFWQWVDRSGQVPGVLMALVALGLLWRSRGDASRRIDRRQCWLVLLLVLLGAGVVVHGLKGAWGRPRPRNVLHWQKPVPSREWWQPGGPGVGTSFPSGHAALAVTTIAGAWAVSRRRSPAARIVWMGTAITFAVIVSVQRLLDGAHHLTDVLWSWVLILGGWWALDRCLPRDPPSGLSPGAPHG